MLEAFARFSRREAEARVRLPEGYAQAKGAAPDPQRCTARRCSRRTRAARPAACAIGSWRAGRAGADETRSSEVEAGVPAGIATGPDGLPHRRRRRRRRRRPPHLDTPGAEHPATGAPEGAAAAEGTPGDTGATEKSSEEGGSQRQVLRLRNWRRHRRARPVPRLGSAEAGGGTPAEAGAAEGAVATEAETATGSETAIGDAPHLRPRRRRRRPRFPIAGQTPGQAGEAGAAGGAAGDAKRRGANPAAGNSPSPLAQPPSPPSSRRCRKRRHALRTHGRPWRPRSAGRPSKARRGAPRRRAYGRAP